MERIYVTVRARPLSAEDAKSCPWRISGNSIALPNQPAKFEFDRVFGEECVTAEVYAARTKEIVASAVQGFNGTVFAYGQTSSGKTHTMRGSTNEPGIIPLAVRDLFRSIQEAADREFLLRISYMEIYNEDINDLLAPEHRKLQIHESIERGIFVAGLKEEIVTSPDQVLQLMEFGESHRHIGETNMNLYSSRSHTIFRMIIESRERVDDASEAGSCDAVRVSVLNLVDLAGSERAAKTGAEGVRLKEGSHINKSLMTLGTVIKKLSEGAESQGGHVPYRDSKLTRILQPSLGGNANTAIICNITLAQVHVDETKSSLQFASRALRVTNCACVNEILTDAALLRRQKKQIEELQARLLGSNSEHLEEEILNLRNTLLQSELEKERIALELEEEKKAKALREKRLQEQAEKIANLSSMVLYSKREEDVNINSNKRRNTWCPGPMLNKSPKDVLTPLAASAGRECSKSEADINLPPTFEELVEENIFTDSALNKLCAQEKQKTTDSPHEFVLPDESALLHVTSRRKAQSRSINLLAKIEEVQEDIDSECTGKIETKWPDDRASSDSLYNTSKCTSESKLFNGEESEQVLVRKLQDQIKLLEEEKMIIQKNLDTATALGAQQATLMKVDEGTADDFYTEMITEIEGVAAEFNSSRDIADESCSLAQDLFSYMSTVSQMFLEFKSLTATDLGYLKSAINNYEKFFNYMKNKVDDLEADKKHLQSQAFESNKKAEEVTAEAKKANESLQGIISQLELEKDEILHHVLDLEKELSHLNASNLAKEKDNLRKDLDKTKLKLKETESKLKNTIQDKSKLESEKAQKDREIKKLQSQRALLEKDICKRDAATDRRREVKAPDINKTKDPAGTVEQQMDYQRLEFCSFEMEAEIASLNEELHTAICEREEAFIRLSVVESEMEEITNKLNFSNSELNLLQEELAKATLSLSELESRCKNLESSKNLISQEKEEMAMQLVDTLLELETEKSRRLGIEKSLSETKRRFETSDNEICSLSNDLVKARRELESCSGQCKILEEKLVACQEQLKEEKQLSTARSLEIEQRTSDLTQHKLEISSLEKLRDDLTAQFDAMATQLDARENVQSSNAIRELEEFARRVSGLEKTIHDNNTSYNVESTKLRMQLRSTQLKLDSYRERYHEVQGQMDLMHSKFEEASKKLKDQLATYGVEILRLKKELSQRPTSSSSIAA